MNRIQFKTIFGYDCPYVAMSKPAFDAYTKAHADAMRATQKEIIALSAKLKALRGAK